MRKKNPLYLCHLSETTIYVIKFLPSDKKFIELEIEQSPPDFEEKALAMGLGRIFRKLEYRNEPVILSLPRSKITCRYLKVPAHSEKEIEKISVLQAPRYLPYAAEELITGHQVISVDKEGYAEINLFIVHRELVERCVRVFKQLKSANLTVTLSSLGLCNLYTYFNPSGVEPVIITDVGLNCAEIIICAQNKLLFSRSVKILESRENWQDLLFEEINKTKQAYLKDLSAKEPAEIIIFGPEKYSQTFKQFIEDKVNIPVKILSYAEKISSSKEFLSGIAKEEGCLASLVGLALDNIPESLNLLPPKIKYEAKQKTLLKEYLKTGLLLLGAIALLGLGVSKNLGNKIAYINRQKEEISKIEKEARPLEELEKRYKFMRARIQKKPSCLDILYEFHLIMPLHISLVNFLYDDGNQVILRGEAGELNSVFELVAKIENSLVFKNFNTKVRYVTKRRSVSAELVDFEIDCLKK